jgi:small subunit ribosomal protein S1
MNTEDNTTDPTPKTDIVTRRRRPSEETSEASAKVITEDPVAVEPAAPVAVQGAGGSLDGLLSDNPEILAADGHGGSALADPALASAEVAAEDLDVDFEALMAASGGMADVKAGEMVRGTIVSITKDTIFIDIGRKAEAQLDRREAIDDKGEPTVAVGEELEAVIVSTGGEAVRLSLGALKAHQLSEMLESAAASGIPVEGTVTGSNDGGLEVRIGNRRAFCPKSQIDRGWVDDLAVYVGKTFEFLVTRYDPTGRKIVVSRRTLLDKQAAEMGAETLATLKPGAVLPGTVRKLMPFGVFVDLGGVDGLIHVSELSWNRVEDPATVVQVGDKISVKVLKIESKKNRISLSLKQAAGDPWGDAVTSFEPGKTYEGTVTRLQDFGAFVALSEGLEGLVHVSELDWKRRITHPKEVLEVGQTIEVLVLELDAKRRRVSLSVKQVAGGDPFREALSGVQVGQKLEVVVEKVADFGVFAVISEGVTGLIPNSHMNTPRGTNHSRSFKPGTKVDVQVIAIDVGKRKITLSRKALEEGGARSDWLDYKKKVKEQEAGGKSAMQLALEAAQFGND